MKRVPDIFCVIGAAMLLAGLWLVHPAAMLCAGGAGLIAAGVFAHRGRNRQPSGGKPQ